MGNIGEDLILKALGGAGALGTLVYLVVKALQAFGVYLKDQQDRDEKKDAVFVASIKDTVGDMKGVMGEVKQTIDGLRTAMVEIDRGHTAQTRDIFGQLIQLNEKQALVSSAVMTKVDHLEETVGRLSDKIEDHSGKLDVLLNRGLPSPAAAGRSPGEEPTAEFQKRRP